MNKIYLFISILLISCNHSDNLKVIADVPSELKEISGLETTAQSDYIWAINDSGNKARLFGLTSDGRIEKAVKIKAKNNDWEDLTADADGNIYIGDFGNNKNDRDNLAILKVSKADLEASKKVNVERIGFYFENQKKFPPKKKGLYFDCEAFFYHNNYFYLFTKTRVKGDFGTTHLYKVPASAGEHKAVLIDTFKTCSDFNCWITAADISPDGKRMVLLTSDQLWEFKDFEKDAFFSGTINVHDLGFVSQKESVCFKDSQTLYIADERAYGEGGNIYEFKF